MTEHGSEGEVRGEIIDISSRFYNEGWGYATLRTEAKRKVKITGILEDRKIGDTVRCFGRWNQDEKYGLSLACDSIFLDALSSRPSSILDWLRKIAPDDEAAEVCSSICDFVEESKRWDVLCAVTALMALGISSELATRIAAAAESYVRMVAYGVQLKKLGFNDQEVRALSAVVEDFQITDAASVYQASVRGYVTFHRADAVAVATWEVEPLDMCRLKAATVGALRKAEADGNSAVLFPELQERAADYANVYPAHTASAILDVIAEGTATLFDSPRFEQSAVMRALLDSQEENIASSLLSLVASPIEVEDEPKL